MASRAKGFSTRWLGGGLAAVAAVAALAGCATLMGPKRIGPPPPPWVAYPDAEIARVKSAHDYQGKPLCQKCHTGPGGALRWDPIGTCTTCHSLLHGNHPVDVVQKNPPKDLPFLAGGKLACHTCHDPHDMKAFKWGLRAQFNALCLKCHQRH